MKLDLAPYRREVEVSGTSPVRLNVIDIGPLNGSSQGTLVCLHGCAGRAEQWEKQIEHLAPNYRVVVPDLRGHGLSASPPKAAFSLEEFLWDFSQLLDLLAIERPFTLLAHSFGGPIAITYAATNAAHVSRLVLIATGPKMQLNPTHEFVVKLPISLAILEKLRPILMPKTYATASVIQKVLAGTLFRWNGYEILPRVKTPTLLIAGQWDFIAPLDQSREAAELLPDARLEVVRYTRHLPHLERPDAVNRLIDRFLVGSRSWRE